MKKARWLILVSILWAVAGFSPTLSQEGSSPGGGQGGEAHHLVVARAPDGSTWAVWEADSGGDADLYFSRWQAGAWSRAQAVHDRPEAWDRQPSVTITADGAVWVVWAATERSARARTELYASRWEGGGWSEPERVPTWPSLEAAQPALAAAPDGSLWLAWVGFDGLDQEIFASRLDEGRWSPATRVSADDEDTALYDAQPCLAVGRDGRPWLIWTGHQEGVDDEIYYSRWDGSGWSHEGVVSRDDDALDVDPALALDADGQPWVAWKGRVIEEDGRHSRTRLWVSRWDAGTSRWIEEELVSSPLSTVVEEEQPVLFRSGGDGMHLAWRAEGAAGRAVAHRLWQDGAWQEAMVLSEDPDVAAIAGDGIQLVALAVREGMPRPVFPTSGRDPAKPLGTWVEAELRSPQVQPVDPIPNRYLAFGDSITCYPVCWEGALAAGAAQDEPYSVLLEQTLDVRVARSEVINAGKSGEATFGGSERITGQVSTHLPKYVLILEGTNDVTRGKQPADVQANLETMIDRARQAAGVADVEVMLSTIIPRADGLNDETDAMNTLAVRPAAQSRGVPVCDQWGAWLRLHYWPNLLEDDGKHPNAGGRILLADTFYGCVLASFPGVSEETTPPAAWIERVPPTVACGEPAALPVTWAGADDLSWVVDYDVQVRFNDGAWSDWLMGTPHTTGTYYASAENDYQDRFYFQVRARDLVGNVGAYSAPAYSEVADAVPPYEAHVNPLPQVVLAPFEVSWWGADACSGVTAYGVQYRSETDVTWRTWLSPTLSQSADLDPVAPAYGERYELRVRPQDAAGNWGSWSDGEASTTLAQWKLEGRALNTRHEPVVGATIDLTPPALGVARRPGGRLLAYLAAGGSYDVAVARPDLYGPLPAMHGVAVEADVDGLSFILAPVDDVVSDGGFEAGDLAAWQVGGSAPPALRAIAHTGLGAVRLGGSGESAYLSQAVTPAAGERLTLSFLVRLEQPGAPGTLQVEVSSSEHLWPPVAYSQTVGSEAWSHVWYDLTGLAGEPMTLTFGVSDTAAILIDEISLGSALQGNYPIYLPLEGKRQGS